MGLRTVMLAAATAVACGATAANADQPKITMIIYTAPGVPFFNPLIKGAEDAAKEADVDLNIQYANNDQVLENNIIETAVAGKVDGIYFKRRILLLDEPTSALSVRETENLLSYIKRLRDENVSSVLVTHNLYHAFQICDRFVVMSHGRKVVDVSKADTTIDDLTRYVVLT